MDSKGLITADRKGLQEHKKCKCPTRFLGPVRCGLTVIRSHRFCEDRLRGTSPHEPHRHYQPRQADRFARTEHHSCMFLLHYCDECWRVLTAVVHASECIHERSYYIHGSAERSPYCLPSVQPYFYERGRLRRRRRMVRLYIHPIHCTVFSHLLLPLGPTAP